MSNIWGFALQTLYLSLTAGLLLVLKRLFADKLSPRWQYGIWAILALRAVLPVSLERSILPRLGLMLETAKQYAEQGMNSAYADPYLPIRSGLFCPSGRPNSLTDWFMILYCAGVLFFLLRSLLAFIRLRLLLRKGAAPNDAFLQRMDTLCEQHRLKPCKAVVLSGLDSAFVCGVLRPVLAVPDNEVEDKILLHELLHLKYGDVLQGIFWNVLRAFHWCNPFMQYVFHRIGNDMESLCDQRVLERLDGEERRAYGVILLEMANRRYPRTPGTSSISNGGKNIARRIGAIVRFKQFPKGMALVSVCIGAVLGVSLLWGHPLDGSPLLKQASAYSLAATRIARCSTVAGALDTYAKGLLTENGYLLAAASPLAEQPYYARAIEADGRLARTEDLQGLYSYSNYQVLNLQKEAGGYKAILAFSADEETCLFLPMRIWKEQGWVARPSGTAYTQKAALNELEFTPKLEKDRIFAGKGESGSVTLNLRTVFTVNNQPDIGSNFYFGEPAFDPAPKLDAEFEQAHISENAEYRCSGKPRETVAIRIAALKTWESRPDFPEIDITSNSSGSHSGGYNWASRIIDESWDGTLYSGGGSGYFDYKLKELSLPVGYMAGIYWDGELVETLLLTEVEE
ncbi:MAG: M56 family metallopeptidase [Clostridia bacterium]|nr:M56 family metallopeptidase [Clostridia bacterium]